MGAEVSSDQWGFTASTLEWWRDAGVDTLVDENPRDWLARRPAPNATAQTPSAEAEAAPPPVVLPGNLEDFEAWRLSDAAVDARWSPTRLGPAGNAAAGVMVLLDMPDREDFAGGQLLSGATGRLFDRMMAAIGRDRASIYLAALSVTRPVSGQLSEELCVALGDLARHHAGLAAPKRLLLMGNAASRALTGSDVIQARGSLHAVNCGGATIEAVSTFHPRFLLENTARKAEAWKDLQLLIRGLES